MKFNKNVLIITPNSEHGELICRSVNKLVSGSVNSVSTIHAVIKYSNGFFDTESSLDFVLLDLEVGIEKARECIAIVRNCNPSVQIIVISKNDPPEEIDSLRPWNLLIKPFVEKDLLMMIENTINQKKVNVIDGKFLDSDTLDLPAWAWDKNNLVNVMQDTLEQLDAQEAIIFSKDRLIASTGYLQKNEVDNCLSVLDKYVDYSGKGELIKQVQLDENIYLVHALVLTVGLIIALLFDPDTSYELIRGQTRHLAGKITQPALTSDRSNPKLNSEPGTRKEPVNRLSTAETVQEKIASSFEVFKKKLGEKIPVDFASSSTANRIDQVEDHPDQKYQTINSNGTFYTEKPKFEKKRPPIISVGMSQLPFTCLLVPRLDPRSISDEVVDFLEEKTPMIFVSYGWKLNDLMIKNNMMQWIAAIPPVIAPSFQIKTIRKETSKLIFERFPKLSMDGLIKDFWLPGYLVAIGSERISELEKNQMIESNQQRYLLDDSNNVAGCARKVLYNN